MPHFALNDVTMEFQILEGTGRRLLHPSALKALGGRLGFAGNNRLTVTALRNITLRIPRGTRLGLLGHNGSGKSTLLRVLAGIYQPTSGRIESDGRITSMFDISLGMDMDLSGFDNVRMQGLLFGLTPDEIETLLPDIVAFTQLDHYLTLPVRTYSAGMMARLSFAIATAKMPEILLLDEVIGAGDAAFQSRAQKRLETFLDSADIIVLASHADDTIRALCTEAVVLEKGEAVFHGDVEAAIRTYRERIPAGA